MFDTLVWCFLFFVFSLGLAAGLAVGGAPSLPMILAGCLVFVSLAVVLVLHALGEYRRRMRSLAALCAPALAEQFRKGLRPAFGADTTARV